MMAPSRFDVVIALARRNQLAEQVRSYCRHLSFQQCLQLCSPVLRDQYVVANRIACFVEEEHRTMALFVQREGVHD